MGFQGVPSGVLPGTKQWVGKNVEEILCEALEMDVGGEGSLWQVCCRTRKETEELNLKKQRKMHRTKLVCLFLCPVWPVGSHEVPSRVRD